MHLDRCPLHRKLHGALEKIASTRPAGIQLQIMTTFQIMYIYQIIQYGDIMESSEVKTAYSKTGSKFGQRQTALNPVILLRCSEKCASRFETGSSPV